MFWRSHFLPLPILSCLQFPFLPLHSCPWRGLGVASCSCPYHYSYLSLYPHSLLHPEPSSSSYTYLCTSSHLISGTERVFAVSHVLSLVGDEATRADGVTLLPVGGKWSALALECVGVCSSGLRLTADEELSMEEVAACCHCFCFSSCSCPYPCARWHALLLPSHTLSGSALRCSALPN